MKKLLRISLWSLAVIACLAVGLILYLRNADLSIYEDEIESYLSEKIGHRLEIDGLFNLQVKNLTSLTAENITLTNTNWSSQAEIISVGHLSVTIDLWSLISEPLIVEDLDVREVRVRLERSSDGEANWSTGRPTAEESSEINTDRIAFRDVRVEDVAIEYVDPARRRPIELSLEHLTISPDAGDILDLDLQGTINEFPLWADGRLGPWQNLIDGKDVTADLDVTLGQVRLSVDGTIADVLEAEGVAATFSLNGPAIERVADRLGLPPFAAGAFEVDGELKKVNDGNLLRMAGNLGQIALIANGNVDHLRAPVDMRFDFNISGPDTHYVAELLGIEGAPKVPFLVSGDLDRQGARLQLKATRAELGENVVAIEGWTDTGRGASNLDLTINAVGPDFSVFAPFISLTGIPTEQFNIDGRIEKSGTDWRFTNVEAVVGENRVAANGAIESGQNTEVEFSAAGPDISFLQAMTGAEGLPEKPFDVMARIKPARDGISIEEASGSIGENQIGVTGIVSTAAGLDGTRLAIEASGPALQHIAPLTGVPFLPDGQFEFSGQVELAVDQVLVSDMSASVGDVQLTASAEVGLRRNAGAFDVRVAANGPDASALAKIDALQPFSGEPFSLNAHIARGGGENELLFEESDFRIGEVELLANGTLSMEPRSNDSDLRFSLSGPDMDQFGQAIGTTIFVARPFDIDGQFTGTPSGFAVRDFTASIGENDINGVFEMDLREKPRLTGTLTSTFLDLSARLEELEDDAAETESVSTDGFLFSDEPLDGEQLQAADIEIDLKIDRLRTRVLDVSDFHVGINLLDGALQMDPVAFREEKGRVEAQIHISPSGGNYVLDAAMNMQDMHLGLLATREQDRNSLPPLSGQLTLRGEGNSLHELMASSDGLLSMRQGKGQILDLGADRIFGDMLLRIIRTLNPLKQEQKYREFDCGIYDVDIVAGVATIEDVAIQTATMTVVVAGNVEFENEKIDLVIRAKPREGLGISLGGVANSFLKLGGTLKEPVLQIDPSGSIVAGGAAVATGGLSLLAKGLFDRVSASADICEPPEDVVR
ncbi:MAG: AsmA-like C-terminal region-containing protein [Woeseiaceae bacterium]